MDLKQIVKWILKAKISRIKRKVFGAVISTLVYHLWRVRNVGLWEKKIGLIIDTVQGVKRDVKLRLSIAKPKKISSQDQQWLDRICTE